MESGEQLTTPSSTMSSPQVASSSASSSPAQLQTPSTKCSRTPSPASSSPLTTYSHLLRMTGDERLYMCGGANTFPLINHPAFGLYMSGSGRSEFGGLGSLGLSSWAAHPQFGTFPDWGRPSEAQIRAAATFFPPLPGLRPVFSPTFKSHDPVPLQSHTSGVNGTVNGRSASSPTANSTFNDVNSSSFPAKGNKEKYKTRCNRSQKSRQSVGHLHQKSIQNTKEKNHNSKPDCDTSSMSGSQSGSLSDSSSDGEEISSDPDDMEEEEDNDEDEGDQSNDSGDSDSERESRGERKAKLLTQNTSESKMKRPCTADGKTTLDSQSVLAQQHGDTFPLISSYRLQSSSHLADQTQSTTKFLQCQKTAEEEGKQHISVIQTTGLAAGSSPLAQSQSEASALPSNLISFCPSFKHFPPSTSPKHFSHSSSPRHSSVSSSPKPLALCSSSRPLSLRTSPKPPSVSSLTPPSLSSLPKPPTTLASQKSPQKTQSLIRSTKHTQLDGMKKSTGTLQKESLFHMKNCNFKMKKPPHKKGPSKQAFSLQPADQDWCRTLKKSASASSLLTAPEHSADTISSYLLSLPSSNDANLFPHPNGEIHNTVQGVPLALINKPRNQSSKLLLAASSPPNSMPLNLSTSTKQPSLKSSPSLGLVYRPGKTLHSGNTLNKVDPSCPPVDLFRGSETDIYSNKDSDDSLEDYYDEDDVEDEDSGSSLSESESNLETDSEGSVDDLKECGETEANSDAERTPLNLGKAVLSSDKSPMRLSANCSLLDLQGIRSPSLHTSSLGSATVTTSGASSNHNTQSPSFTLATLPGSGKRRRITDERVLRLPLQFGWQRETQIRTMAGRLQGEVAYFAPCGKKLRQYPDVIKYLLRNGITELSRDNFSFSTKIKVGDFYEAKEGPEGLQWVLLAEEEIAPSIIAMDGRRSRGTNLNGAGTRAKQRKGHLPNVVERNFRDFSDAKLLRKLEAQEIARQAAQIKMMRKLEKQAMAQAAKEARKQQAIMAAEEKKRKRDRMKILKQQEKIKRIQQNRMEKELRAQQILEMKRKKKEEAANAKIMEADKRNKEKEMRRLQAFILKHQELERHRLDMERERRRQHMMLMKAVEARKKAEVKERLKKEKKDQKRLNKERKLELRRLELEKAKELKKPNEDMCLADHKPLPELSSVPGLVLSGSTFSDCLMVLQFLRMFGKVLGLDVKSNTFNLSDLQEGLLNVGECMGKVQDLLVNMLSVAVCDPGIPPGHKNKTALGDHLTNVGINRDNVSEILRLYIVSHSEQTEMAALAFSLRTKAFQAHSPSQKASMLAFLVNELCCSKAVISEIDKNIDYMTNLRKDKWAVEGELRKMKSIHAKKTGKRDSSVSAEYSHTFISPTARNKCKRKEGDSEEEEDEDDESEDQGDDDEEEEEEPRRKKVRKADMCEEEDNSVHSASVEELEKQIEKTYKQQNRIRQRMFDSSSSLRSMMIGQDRYKRCYWVLPQCGGIFVEGVEHNEGFEDYEEEKKIQMADLIGVKEELHEETEKTGVSSSTQSKDSDITSQEQQQEKEGPNLLIQKPESFSTFSKLLDDAKMARDSDVNSQNSQNNHSTPTTEYYPTCPKSQTDTSEQSLLSTPLLKSNPWMTCSPQSILHDDQLAKIQTEKNNQWFSLLPRSPCDESSVTSGSSPPASSSPPPTISTKSPLSPSPNPLSTASSSTPTGINNMQLSPLQQVQFGIHQSRMTLYDVSNTMTSPSLHVTGTSLAPMLDLSSQHAEGNESGVVFMVNNNSVCKSETPEPPSDSPPCVSFPAVAVAKTQDYPCPQLIPEEMLRGWWRVSDMEELHSLVRALNSRGIREKILQKQIQKHMEYVTQLCASSKDVIDDAELKRLEVSEETVKSWCVEEQAMEVDISLLQQVEDLERKVISASLQVKSWKHPAPQSEREDLVYHEHKPSSFLALDKKGQRETWQEEHPGTLVRQPNNPLDIAVTRLEELERNIERSEEEVAPGMRLWGKALGAVRSSAQLSLCIQQLHKSIAWEHSIMKTESSQSPWSKRHQSRAAGGGKKGSEVKRNSKSSVVRDLIKEEAASSSVPKKSTKEFKKRRGDDSPPNAQANHDTTASCAKKAKDNNTDELSMCRVLLAELEAHQDAWPFLSPVKLKAVPGYRKVIKKPMDFSTIRDKLTNNQYLNWETFIVDVNLVFDNCEKFNEDDSEIGRAGHNMRRFFDRRWAELLT